MKALTKSSVATDRSHIDVDEPIEEHGAARGIEEVEEVAFGEPAAVAEDTDHAISTGPDDALGLYLKQMGAIPLLTRDKELSLA